MSLSGWFLKTFSGARSFRKVGGFDDGQTKCIQITADGYRSVPFTGKPTPWTPCERGHFTLTRAERWVAAGLWEELK